jgi:hypothetical protein
VTARAVLTGGLVVGLLGAGAVNRAVEPGVSSEVSAAAGDEGGYEWAAEVLTGIEPPAVLSQTRPERMLTQSVALLQEARSVRMRSDTVITRSSTTGTAPASQRVRTDLRMDHDGNCTGTWDAGVGNRGTIYVLAGKGDDGTPEAYMRFSEQALAEVEGLAAARGGTVGERVRARVRLIRGKYVHLPAGPKGADAIAKECNFGEVLGAAGDTEGTRALSEVRRDGRRVVPLVPPQGSKEKGSVYVDATGKPYMRAMSMTSDDMKVDLRFSDYGAPLAVRRPPAAQIVELPQSDGSVFDA